MAFATLNDLRGYLRLPIPSSEPVTPTPEDNLLALALDAASTSIARACGRTFEPAGELPTARTFTARRRDPAWGDSFDLEHNIEIDDTFTPSVDVVVKYGSTRGIYDTTATESVLLTPRDAARFGKPFTKLTLFGGYLPRYADGVEVTALWGWPEIPGTIKMATLLQASRLVKRRDAPFGVTGSAEMGTQIRLLAKLDPDVELMIADFRRWWVS